MSQMGTYVNTGVFPPGSVVQALTGNTGGRVGPDATNNINVVGTDIITVTGNPGTNTLTISSSGSVATTYTEDSGTATPAAGNLNVFGGTAARDINTSGSGSTIHIDLNNAITLGDLSSIIGSAALTLVTGDATITAGNLNMRNTTSNQLEGVITYGGFRFINNFGDRSTWVGLDAGNPGGITTAADNTGMGYNALTAITTGNSNTAMGSKALQAATTSLGNTCIGFQAGTNMISTGENTAIGYQSLQTLSTGSGTNIAIGSQCMRDVTLGIFNVAIGNSALLSTTTGGYNTCIGLNAGRNYTSTESSNIVISQDPAGTGTLGESNVIRIGSPGSGNGQQNKCFIAGIDGVNVGSVAKVVTEASNQLGTATLTAGSGISITPTANTITIAATGSSGIITLNGNTGSATGSTVSILGSEGSDVFTGSGSTLTLSFTYLTQNTYIGQGAGNIPTSTGSYNSGFGYHALDALTTGQFNCALGRFALGGQAPTDFNTGVGYFAGQGNTGSNNTSIGGVAFGSNNTSGSNNTCIGYLTGSSYNSAESSNILIGSSVTGVAAETHVLRIGAGTGSGTGQLNAAFISGIDGVNVGSVARVVTEASNQLGTAIITAGTGISVTPGANTITIAATGTTTLTYTNVNTSPYVVLTTDDFLGVDSSGGAIQINLPNAPSTGRVFVIKDRTGSAATHNITVTTVGGVVNIDGATTFVMNTAYQSIQVLFDGSTYQIF